MSASQQSDPSVVPAGVAKALVLTDRGYEGLAMVTSPAEALRRYQELQAFCQSVFVRDVDYGQITNAQKPCLFQPGAQKLCELYGFAQDFAPETTVEDWEKGFFFYRKKCLLTTRKDLRFVGAGLGSCNSKEDRYAGRWAFDNEVPAGLAIATLKKREGTGRNGKPYVQYKVPNDDPYSLVNTLEKMACKRALIHAVLGVTRMSGMFTQDVEDLPPEFLGVVDDVRPWESVDADVDAIAAGFQVALDKLVAKRGTKAEFDAIGLAIEQSPLGAGLRTALRKHCRECMEALTRSQGARAKTDAIAEKVNARNAERKKAPPPSTPRAAEPDRELQDPGYDDGPYTDEHR